MTLNTVVCVGEALWDVLPGGEFLGGAPLNVATHLARLGVPSHLISRVGHDARGRRALEQIRALGVDAALLQIDPTLPTGTAEATLDASGSATYRFPSPCAWDAIAATESALAAARGATVVFGTLAQRETGTAGALASLLSVAHWRVFDANLRAPHDDAHIALESLRRSDFVKLNEHEVVVFGHWLAITPSPLAVRDCLRADFGVRSLCVTEGERGAHLWHDGAYIEEAAYPTTVADTIGAGDAFLAMLLAELLQGSAPAVAMRRAARLASFVASMPGACPAYDPARFRI